jgi:Raf kinase inhibitor-like YbhB/YbcL family protein
MRVTSPAFGNSQPIPGKYAAGGDNISPPLHVDGLPPGTKELAVIVEDPDAPRAEPFVHWVAYKIPPVADVPENILKDQRVSQPIHLVQGRNDRKDVGYVGPYPPPGSGPHHYHFRVFALDQPLEVDPAADSKALRASMAGHVLDSAEIVGVYEQMR